MCLVLSALSLVAAIKASAFSFRVCMLPPSTTHQIYSGDQIKKNATSGHVACMGDNTGAYRVSVGTPEGNRPLGIP